MDAVDQLITSQLTSEVALINDIADYIISAGGKRIRPLLVLLTAQALGEITPHHHRLAAIIEYIHTATLLHDDVIDESTLRRGKPSANQNWGDHAPILVGDYLYALAFETMNQIESPLVNQVLAQATKQLAEGEVLQLIHKQTFISQAEYLQIITAKTARLFEAATELSATLSTQDEPTIQALKKYGHYIGIAFQMIDDILDYSTQSKKLGKNTGDDLRDGKLTLPLIIAMESGSSKQAAIIRDAISQKNGDQLNPIIKILKETDALNDCKEIAVSYANKALQTLETVNTRQTTTTLQSVIEVIIDRIQ